ncbi:hypothetical protein WOLCODRAFT_154284 [Wolfiporia cocos MD-104 SS10]|uniref:Uncharacterized protein n=1 Tax=Wolfiporia cocos (strain MD-104) TaxID=742152 RepID=A0A2H3JQ21_WOLCO|nr:hypothetical protein WOLCODRAFT_154284 [Wolfiporia cocos MD-104 SS10]
MRGTLEPAYPSFAHVISCVDNDTCRSPSHRESYRRRYHPYSSKSRRQPGNDPMNTVDHRYEDALRIATVLLAYTPNAVANHEARDVEDMDGVRHPTDRPKRRHKFSGLIVDLALAARRRIARMGTLQKWTLPARLDLTS